MLNVKWALFFFIIWPNWPKRESSSTLSSSSLPTAGHGERERNERKRGSIYGAPARDRDGEEGKIIHGSKATHF
jgi:hypothetical protein